MLWKEIRVERKIEYILLENEIRILRDAAALRNDFSGKIEHLKGLQRKIFLIIYCLSMCLHSKITGPLAPQNLSEIFNVPRYSIKNAIAGLKKKGLIKCKEFKSGSKGWTKYSIF